MPRLSLLYLENWRNFENLKLGFFFKWIENAKFSDLKKNIYLEKFSW